jgi:hypothetical protein
VDALVLLRSDVRCKAHPSTRPVDELRRNRSGQATQGAGPKTADGDSYFCIYKYNNIVYNNTTILYNYIQLYLDKYNSKS